MSIQSPIELIGKKLNELLEINYSSLQIAKKSEELGIQKFKSKNELIFLGEKFQSFYFKTDKNQIITNVTFTILEIAKRKDYMDYFNKEFGEPLYSSCFNKVIRDSETIIDDGSAVAGNILFSTRKCNYKEEQPILSTWKIKKKCYLQIVHPDRNNMYQRIKVILINYLPKN